MGEEEAAIKRVGAGGFCSESERLLLTPERVSSLLFRESEGRQQLVEFHHRHRQFNLHSNLQQFQVRATLDKTIKAAKICEL